MTPLYRLIGLRPLARRWDRSALVALSIALGVATLVSSRILNDCIESAAAATTTPLKAGGDLFVTNGELGVTRAVAEDLKAAEIPGVKAVRPLLYERIVLTDLGDRPAVLLGADLSAGPKDADELLQVDVSLTDSFAVVGFGFGRAAIVSKPIFDALGDATTKPGGARISLRVGNRTATYAVAGYFVYRPGSPASAMGTNVVALELSAVARFLHGNSPPRVNRVDLVLNDRNQMDAVRTRVREIVGGRARVETPESQGQSTQEFVSGVKIGFTLCSFGAMIVGLFMVYNAMAVTVAERRSEIGIMRSIGATRGQVIRAVAGAAAALGLIGAAIGVPLGIGLARYALSQFHELLESIFLNPDAAVGWPGIDTIVMAIAAGIATAVFAALVPALQAAGEDPADVVRHSGGRIGPGWRIIHLIVCALFVVGGIAMILARNQLPARVGGFGGMMLALIGMLLAAPLFVGGMIALVSPMLRNILPVEARIAADNLTRSPGRTGLVIGTLAAGVTVMVQTAGVAHSNEKPFTTWLNQMLRADLYVFGGSMATGTSSGAPMEASVVTTLGQQPGVLKTTAIRFARPEFNGTIVYLIAVDAASFAETMTSRGDGPADLYKYRAVRDDRVVVSENFADRHRIRPGHTITLTGVQGPVTLTVIDTVVDYSWSRGTIFMDRSAFAERFGDRRVDLIHVFAKPGEMDTAKRNAEAYGSTLGLTVVERAAAQELLIGLIDRLSLLAYLQQIVVGIVASLGVVTALLISVLQRKRELGLLLAVGATPGQILRSVLWEAGFMGLLGTTLGLLVGFPLEWYAVRILVYEESGFSFAVLMPWRAVLTITTGAIALATLAGVLPAIKAVRTRVVDAITYE